MIAKQIIIKNFKQIKSLEINFDGKTTYLIGVNGSGKTSVIDAIIVLLKGKKALPTGESRFKMIEDNADKCVITGTLQDGDEEIVIKRTITKKNVMLDISTKTGAKLNQGYLDKIFNEFCLNPGSFAELSPKAQALSIGIDTSEFDKKYKNVYAERTALNRDLKNAKSVVDDFGDITQIEKISISELLKEKKEIDDYNSIISKKIDNIVHYNTLYDEKDKKIKVLLNEVELLQKQKKGVLNEITQLESENLEYKDTSVIDNKIANADEINIKAAAWDNKVKKIGAYELIIASLDGINDELNIIKNDKINYIIQSNLPFSNMTIDEDGGLLINDKPFNKNFFSQGEIWKISCKLLKSFNPQLKFVFVKDASLLDEDKIAEIKALEKDGFSFIFELVGKEKINENSILLKESEIVESYQEKDINNNSL